NPDWTRRRIRDAGYADARIPQVPSMLLELLSHQNFADMKYGLDPRFRFDVCRAVYKGILKYFSSTGACRYIVQPLPPDSFAIHASPLYGQFRLSWSARSDSLEPTATPTKYMVEERIDRGIFKPVGTTDDTYMDVKINDTHIHSYRITAMNNGGSSFPSETLALCAAGEKTPVMIVNGFTRVSGPYTFESGTLAGFDYKRDFGVPYMYDLAFSGEQTEFDRTDPFISNDHPGFGASRAYFDTDIAAGNTSDYVMRHGESIRRAGHPFISSSVSAFTADTLTRHAIVDMIFGKQKRVAMGRDSIGNDYAVFTPQLRHRLRQLAESGTGIIVSGSYIGSDAWRDKNASADERDFAEHTLGYRWRSSRSTAIGKAHEVKSAVPVFGTGKLSFAMHLNSSIYSVESPDAIMAADSCSSVILRYDENNYPAGIAYRGSEHRAIALGFPIETIESDADRHRFIRQALEFITNKQD
ncbi:MAG: xanthan lyase, partial [Muribaculaceae bacterium]|nr:xanthan lyase [Muribaculaceae bacterium]